MGFKRALRVFADQLHRQAEALAVDTDKIFGQRQDIARLLAQRRQVKTPLAQVVIKPLVKFSGSHRLCQIDAGGGYQTHIDRARLVRAHSCDFVVFQGGEQLDLNGQRQVADLIQIQSAAVGRAKPAGPTADRTAVRSGGITEQLRIGVSRADGTAVD